MTLAPEEWAALLERLWDGDRAALLTLSRLINSFLVRWDAYSFQEDWDDLIQEVVLAAALAVREGRMRDRKSVIAYLRTSARFKFIDRLREHLRCAPDESLPLEEMRDPGGETPESLVARTDLQKALQKLPESKRLAVLEVYARGRTYEEAAKETGIPLGTLKRHLREGLSKLRQDLGGSFGHG